MALALQLAISVLLSVGANARNIEFVLETGSCWGQSSERRTISPRKGDARWEQTRTLLNEGLAASRPRPSNGDCYLPNWSCGFHITVDGRKLTGCCNGSPAAAKVAEAFRRLP